MGTFFQYTGVGGSYFGAGLPTSTIITASEKAIAQTPPTDERQPVQGGVLVTAQVSFGVSTTAIATFLCRASTLGTSTAVSGSPLTYGGNAGTGTYIASIGTSAGTIGGVGNQNLGPFTFTWVDYAGTAPLPVYQLTGITASGTATVASAVITVTPIAS